MEKRYQVFLSSTFLDLVEERRLVLDTLIGHRCFPVGMENFPALTMDSLSYIYKLIEESDFFLLMLGGVYGSSRDSEGNSFTHLEWVHAIKHNKPVIALYRKDWEKHSKLKEDPEDATSFSQFLKDVKTKHDGAKPWTHETLAALVIEGIDQAIQDHPEAIGWVRGDAHEKRTSTDDTFEKEKMVCLGIADKILTDIDYDDWYFWTSWLTSADGPSLALDRERALENMITYINKSAIWPNSFPRVKAAFENFAAVAKDLLKQFFKHAEIKSATSDKYTTKKFYKIPEDNPNYKEDSAKYDKHVDIIHAYTFELTKAINYVCDIIREDVDKTYRAVDGKRYITRGYEQGGFYNYFPEYSDKDLKDCKPPYPGAEAFLRRLGIS